MSIKVAAGQFCSSANIPHNFAVIRKLLYLAVENDVNVLFLPEASDYLSKNAAHSYRLSLQTEKLLIEPLQSELQNIYRNSKKDKDSERGVSVSIGVHEPAPAHLGEKTINKLLYFNNRGELVQEYAKLHLFDVNIKNGPILKESNSVVKGDKILPPFPATEKSPFKIGLQICYDIRFPELSLQLFKMGANILTFPSAFTVKTGLSHWQTLGKARAIDSQCYVVMAAQCGKHDLDDSSVPIEKGSDVTRLSYGNSLIIDPWGDIIGSCSTFSDEHKVDADGDYYELCTATLDLEHLNTIRQNMPLLNHRRNDLFGEQVLPN